MLSDTKTLKDLLPSQSGAVLHMTHTGGMRRRLSDIGLVQDTVVECVGVSPSGDPSAYLIRGAVIALRKQDAEKVAVRLL